MIKRAFTLAEVLITLAIIGVVAALTIPSVVANTQQQEFKTGLKKAVSVLNSAITMNMALEGESPYDNVDLFNYLQRHMSVMESTTKLKFESVLAMWGETGSSRFLYVNAGFYTTDGMRFEFGRTLGGFEFPLYESIDPSGKPTGQTINACSIPFLSGGTQCGGCGSRGLMNNPDNTTKPPCIVTVDVNGDRKPTPYDPNCNTAGENGRACAEKNIYWTPDPNGKKIYDVFSIMITDKQAIPYGAAAQKAMYNTQK